MKKSLGSVIDIEIVYRLVTEKSCCFASPKKQPENKPAEKTEHLFALMPVRLSCRGPSLPDQQRLALSALSLVTYLVGLFTHRLLDRFPEGSLSVESFLAHCFFHPFSPPSRLDLPCLWIDMSYGYLSIYSLCLSLVSIVHFFRPLSIPNYADSRILTAGYIRSRRQLRSGRKVVTGRGFLRGSRPVNCFP